VEKGCVAAQAGCVTVGQDVIAVDPRYFRPSEVELLLGDSTKARQKLGWQPRLSFADLVNMMVDSDLAEQRRELYLRDGGYEVKNHYE
jgi:GDPmannose 4,6-dehydratase